MKTSPRGGQVMGRVRNGLRLINGLGKNAMEEQWRS